MQGEGSVQEVEQNGYTNYKLYKLAMDMCANTHIHKGHIVK